MAAVFLNFKLYVDLLQAYDADDSRLYDSSISMGWKSRTSIRLRIAHFF